MRIVIIGILVILAVIVLVSGLFNQKRISWLLIFVLLVPAGVTTWFEIRWQNEVKLISTNIVAPISGISSAKVDCQRLTFALVDAWASEKLTDGDAKTVGMKYAVCSPILEYLRADPENKPDPTIDQLKSMVLLGGESARLAGKESNEARLTCLGVRNLPLIVQALGGTKNQGIRAALNYQESVLDKNPKYTGLQCVSSS